ncbi:hypothetical protein R5W24_006222 [Gemmata sp. JC717]|uniref:hypothetical protein n=1 Tax=Gemmata algarum TaxID=2975278 RepID=UPI0021BAE091|nr:hypothetical protein [Gemmata algarum]MDY3557038.1 hypothetical protein [Gemmata algarum]
MTMRLGPNTAALVVGIEKYADPDPAWDLPHAAASARAFAAWLVKHGVRPDRVRLHLSELPPAGPPAEGEVGVRDAKYETVRASLMSFDDASLDLLVVYWTGHGFADPDRRRWLDCADSTERDRRALSFDSMLAVARSHHWPPRSAAFVDSCASHLEAQWEGGERLRAGAPRDTPRQFVLYSAQPGRFAQIRPADHRASFAAALRRALVDCAFDPVAATAAVRAHFAALRDAGETAQVPVFLNIDWDGNETGDGKHPPAAGEPAAEAWDWRHRALAEALARHPTLSARAERAALARGLGTFDRPAAPLDDGAAFAAWLARSALSDTNTLDELLDALDRPGAGGERAAFGEVLAALDAARPRPTVPWADVAELRRRLLALLAAGPAVLTPQTFAELAAPYAAPDPLPPHHRGRPGVVAAWLADRWPNRPDAPPLLRFVRDVQAAVEGAREAAPPERAEQLAAHAAGLDGWVAGAARRLGVRPPVPHRAAPDRPRLVARLTRDPYAPNGWELHAWHVTRRPGHERADVRSAGAWSGVTRDEAARRIDECARTVRGAEVELFLPVDELVHGAAWAFTLRRYQQAWLDARHPVRLRCLDRLPPRAGAPADPDAPFDEVARRDWAERWAAWTNGARDRSAVAPLDLSAGDEAQLYNRLLAAPPVCVAESLCPPGRAGDPAAAAEVLECVLLAGTPIVVWPGTGAAAPPISGCNGCGLQTLHEFVAQCPPDQLPDRVLEQRRTAVGLSPPPAWNLCLLWDDPGSVPPDHDDRYTSPTR